MNQPWVLVTGGALRLGADICKAFAAAGWNVACHYRNSSGPANALIDQLQALGVQAVAVQGSLDCARDAQQLMERTLAATQAPLQCLVNNASLFEPDAATDFSETDLLALLRTNLVVPLELGKLLHAQQAATAQQPAAVVHLLDQKVFNLNPDYYSYTLSKLALERSVVQQAQALAPLVRVNAVAPGLLYISGPQTQENFERAGRANLMRHPIDPAQVAQTVLFLASNPCITGMSVCVDNGQHLVPTERDIMFVAEQLAPTTHPDTA